MQPSSPTNRPVIATVFSLLGIGVLVPWNAFISAKPYFEARLCAEPAFVTDNVEAWFSLLYNIAAVFCLIVMLFIHSANDGMSDDHDIMISLRSTQTSAVMHPLSATLRKGNAQETVAMESTATHYTWYMVMIPLALYLAVFLVATIKVLLPSIPSSVFVFSTLIGICLCGLCTSIASAGIIGTAGLFDADIGIMPYVQGQAVGGLLVSLANFIAAYFEDPQVYLQQQCGEPRDRRLVSKIDCVQYTRISWTTFSYFGLGCVVLLACIIGYHLIEQFKRMERRGSYAPIINNTPVAQITSLANNDGVQRISTLSTVSIEMATAERNGKEEEEEGEENGKMTVQHLRDMSSRESDGSTDSATLSVWKSVRGPAAAIFFNYVITLALFPVITSELSSVHLCQNHKNRFVNDLFIPMSFVVFNVGDLVGRLAVVDLPLEKISHLPRRLVLLSIARFIFLPLFFLCYSQKSAFQTWAVKSDLFSWTVQFAFALTNGMMTSVCFSHAPSLIPSTTMMQQISSVILNFSLCFGLLCGSFLSFPLLWYFTGRR